MILSFHYPSADLGFKDDPSTFQDMVAQLRLNYINDIGDTDHIAGMTRELNVWLRSHPPEILECGCTLCSVVVTFNGGVAIINAADGTHENCREYADRKFTPIEDEHDHSVLGDW